MPKKTKKKEKSVERIIKGDFIKYFTVAMLFLFLGLAFNFKESIVAGLGIETSSVEELPTLNTSPTVSLAPSIVNKPSDQSTQYSNTDPVIECSTDKCGPINIRKSLCVGQSGYICCEVNGVHSWYSSRTKCDQDQNQNRVPSNSVGGRKVSIYIDDGGGLTKGTFYCYEDKVNYLSNLQNQIRIKESGAESCYQSHKNEIVSCMSNCSTGDNSCYNGCSEPFLQQCGNYQVGDMRKQLYSDVRSYCP